MKIVITGYTYTRQNLFDVFESYPEKGSLFFVLPGNWTAKNGVVKFPPFRRPGFHICNSPAYFTHSHYPFIGGLLKGWMPFLPFWLVWLRVTQRTNILFTAGEPNLLSTLYNAMWAKLLGMKHVFHYWENIPYDKKDRGLKLRFKRGIIRINLALSDGAVCGMTKAADILQSFRSDIRIGVFPHAGLDEQKFGPDPSPDTKSELGVPGKTVFLFVGALSYRKGVHVALRAFAELARDRNDIVFIIVGSGEYGGELQKLADELDIKPLVKFIPWLPNEQLPRIYNAADVFLYPSIPHQGWEEQLGYSIAEASLCGLPVISTRSGSIDEVMVDGETGIMVTPDDPKELTYAMRKLADDPELRHRLGVRGRAYIIGRYSNKVIAEKLFGLFRLLTTH